MVCAADGVFVVFHHHQGVAFVAQLVQGVEQNLVVARMQSNGRLVEHVAHALQVTAQLRGQADALRFAATQCGRAAVEREVTQTDFFKELQAALDLGHQVAGDVGFAAHQLQCFNPAAHIADRQAGDVGDAPGLVACAMQLHGACRGVQPRALAAGASGVDQVFDFRFGKGLLAAFVFVIAHRVVEDFALVFAELDARAHAVRAPAVLAVVREQARVEFGV